MCEIQLVYGFGKDVDKKSFKKFKHLLNCGARYNNDAHGYLQLTKDTVYMDKTRKLKRLFKLMDYHNQTKFLLGHNRFATCVGKSFKDNHPFEITDKYYWVHNGILYNSKELQKKYKLPCESNTDSEVIGHLINHFTMTDNCSVEEAIIKTIKELEGSYSVVFYDLKEQRIYYFKEKSTEFYFCMGSNKILFGTTVRENLFYNNIKKGLGKCWEFELIPEPYTVYEFTYRGLVILSKTDEPKHPERELVHYANYSDDGYEWDDEDIYGGKCEWCNSETGMLIRNDHYNVYMCEECDSEAEQERELWDYDQKLYKAKKEGHIKEAHKLARFM